MSRTGLSPFAVHALVIVASVTAALWPGVDVQGRAVLLQVPILPALWTTIGLGATDLVIAWGGSALDAAMIAVTFVGRYAIGWTAGRGARARRIESCGPGAVGPATA